MGSSVGSSVGIAVVVVAGVAVIALNCVVDELVGVILFEVEVISGAAGIVLGVTAQLAKIKLINVIEIRACFSGRGFLIRIKLLLKQWLQDCIIGWFWLKLIIK